MGTVRKTVTFTSKQDEWIKAQIDAGEFTNDSEYLRSLVRRDQSGNAKFLALRTALQKGMDSGVSEKNVQDIIKEVEERLKGAGRL